MNVVLRPGWTMQQFLDWEERQPMRYGFDGTNVIDMNGATIRHQLICENLFFSLRQHLQGRRCRAILPTQVRTSTTVRYPDVGVTCSPQVGSSRQALESVILFEVTSESTETTDLMKKLTEYTNLPSLRQYVVLSQAEICVLSYAKSGDNWILSIRRNGSLDLPEIGVTVPLADIYDRVTFD